MKKRRFLSIFLAVALVITALVAFPTAAFATPSPGSISPGGSSYRPPIVVPADPTPTDVVKPDPTPTEPSDEEIIAMIKSVELVARSKIETSPKGKNAIKIYWYVKDGRDLSEFNFDGYEIYRSVKKNSGYSKKPFFVAKKLNYFNTAIKSGTKYYYKVRAFKVVGGEKIYTAFSLKAYRRAI